MEIAVKCSGIRKSFGQGSLRFEVLHGIDLEVKSGELLMLVGPSGSGKTTLISILAGILSHDAGECFLFDQNIDALTDAERTKFRGENIGYVFQAFNLIPMLSNAENVAIPLLLNHMERNEAIKQAEKRLVQFGLEDKIGNYPKQLSGGQQQRVAIARAVIHNPRLIVCDEPTSALDHENGMLVLNHLREIVDKENRALIVVTHDSRIFDFADRIIHMEDGNITENKLNNT
ncbi:MAG: ABC transporter ATP-binding protein [Simkaniaceae bacterium]|jgi:putative ABC transport system ATP-binding protein|nr:MAG: ABC transporter ATP-binding protein [Simkaniaceae bacterium]